MADDVGPTFRRRRRRPGGQRQSPLRHPSAGRVIAGLVTLAAVADVVGTAAALHGATGFYGLVGPGMTRDDVRYAMGRPQGVTDGSAGAWVYRQGTATTRIAFDADGKFDGVTCRSDKDEPGDCPDVLGLRLGTGEESVLDALGLPDRQSYAGDTKILRYDSLGLTFALRKLQVVELGLSRSGHTAGYLGRLPRILVP